MTVSNKAKFFRREILTHICDIQINGKILNELDRIPILMRPKSEQSVRCCVYHDRAIVKYKIMAMLGFSCKEEEDELKPLRSYFEDYKEAMNKDTFLLNVADEACSACQRINYVVTNMCRGCVGRPCSINCPKDAIRFEKDKAVIDEDKCVNCGLCQKVCPFHAIIYSPVPCEDVCPVNAISKDEDGKEIIDPDKCILCGKCMDACPFGAIVEKSHLFKVIQSIQNKEEIVAIVAPALAGQFREPMGKIISSIKKLGFSKVFEVAEGADITTRNEAAEFKEKAERGELMTTSCCPAYVQLIEKHNQDLLPFVSSTLSPMKYSAKLVKEKFPKAKIVFVGPCIGKKQEAENVGEIEYVINFEEIGSWLVAAKIEVSKSDEAFELDSEISSHARNYATAGGVSQAVFAEAGTSDYANVQFDGIDKNFARKLKVALKDKKPTLVEVMACEGGCVGGCSNIADVRVAKRNLSNFIQSLSEK